MWWRLARSIPNIFLKSDAFRVRKRRSQRCRGRFPVVNIVGISCPRRVLEVAEFFGIEKQNVEGIVSSRNNSSGNKVSTIEREEHGS
jgi:hypothetical protein